MLPSAGHLAWISKLLTEALAAAPSSLAVEPRIYVTGASYPIPKIPSIEYDKYSPPHSPPPSSSSVSSVKDDKFELELPLYSTLQLKHGRPSIRKLLQEEITTSQGPVSVDGR